MTGNRPNVLFLTIDALRADRVGFLGYDRPTTPRLDALAGGSLVCTRAVATAAFTQPSFHSFFTSSRPFSHGGYDGGTRGRPSTLFEAFHDAGYETHVLSTFPWITRLAGYDKGIDNQDFLFVVNSMVGIVGVILRTRIEKFESGEIDAVQLLQAADPVIEELFDCIEHYCEEASRQAERNRADFSNSRLIRDGYDFRRIRKLIARHRAEKRDDPTTYVARHLTRPFSAHQWLAAEWRLYRTWPKLFREGVFEAGNRLLEVFDRRRAELRRMRFKRYVDGHDLADRVIATLERHDRDKPFFLWTHFIDTHVPYCAGTGPRWYLETPDYLEALGYDRTLDVSVAVGGRPGTPGEWAVWSALYDAAVRYVDAQVGRIIEALDRLGLSDETLVVICGDHGEELGEHGDISHHFRFHSHNVHVPLIFHGAGVKGERNDSLATLMDLAPTLAAMTGIEPDPRWEGAEITGPAVAGRDHVVLEIFHGGTCDFDRRPPYMAVRTKRHNYLWKEYRDPTDRFSPETNELYDLRADPGERNNLYRPDHPLVAGFNAIIARRLSEIPEFAPERIDAAFGPDWRTNREAS